METTSFPLASMGSGLMLLNVSSYFILIPLTIHSNRNLDIAPGDISNIISRLSSRVYISQEVIYGGGEPITPNQYTGNGDVQEYV